MSTKQIQIEIENAVYQLARIRAQGQGLHLESLIAQWIQDYAQNPTGGVASQPATSSGPSIMPTAPAPPPPRPGVVRLSRDDGSALRGAGRLPRMFGDGLRSTSTKTLFKLHLK